MAKRKAISKKIRFEVFKRDSFKCQYCGACSPDVLLQVDHLLPVSKGGDNDITNLVTSCVDCNAGKSDREISDDSILSKQRSQLEELSERREQLKLMMQWRKGLKSLKEESLDALCEAWRDAASPFYLNEQGRNEAAKLLAKFSLADLLEAVETSTSRYLQRDDAGKPTQDSVEICWRKVGGIAGLKSAPDELRKIYYIRGILRNRLNYVNETAAIIVLRDAARAGVDMDEVQDLACSCTSWTDFNSDIYDAIQSAKGNNLLDSPIYLEVLDTPVNRAIIRSVKDNFPEN